MHFKIDKHGKRAVVCLQIFSSARYFSCIILMLSKSFTDCVDSDCYTMPNPHYSVRIGHDFDIAYFPHLL